MRNTVFVRQIGRVSHNIFVIYGSIANISYPDVVTMKLLTKLCVVCTSLS